MQSGGITFKTGMPDTYILLNGLTYNPAEYFTSFEKRVKCSAGFYRAIRSQIFRVLMTLFGKMASLSYNKAFYPLFSTELALRSNSSKTNLLGQT